MKTTRSILTVLALLLVSVPLQAAEAAGDCKKCDQHGTHWDCVGGESSGGTGCSLQGDSCTVSGICSGGGGTEAFYSAKVSVDLIRDIASVHPRLAASVWNLSLDKKIRSSNIIYWTDGPVSADDVEALVAGKPIRFKSRHKGMVAYRAVVQEGPLGTPELVLSPLVASKRDPGFVALVIPLDPTKPDLSEGYLGKTWQMF